jgi:hypothetical protein
MRHFELRRGTGSPGLEPGRHLDPSGNALAVTD